MKYPLVEVEWTDSTASGGWRSVEAYQKNTTSVVRSAGYRIKNSRKEVLLVQSLDDREGCADSLIIPRVLIRSMRKMT